MSEKLSSNNNHEQSADRLTENREALREHLEDKREREANRETNVEKNVEKARAEIDKIKDKHEKEAARQTELSPAEKRKATMASRRQLNTDVSFNRTMKTVRSEMSAPSRAFSKFIHNKAVERISDVAGNTIARPNALLSGAIMAFVFTTALYLWARNTGYPLSGFETIAAFIVGYLVGVIIDFARIMFTGRQ